MNLNYILISVNYAINISDGYAKKIMIANIKLITIFLTSKTISVLHCYIIGPSMFSLLPDAVLVLVSELEYAE